MNPLVLTWLYILATVTFLYWFIVNGVLMFPNVHPMFISLIGMLVDYYLSNRKAVILMI